MRAESVESNVIPIETRRFLEETVTESLYNAPTIYDDNNEEDPVH